MSAGVLDTSLGDVDENSSCKKNNFIQSKTSSIKNFFSKFVDQYLLIY